MNCLWAGVKTEGNNTLLTVVCKNDLSAHASNPLSCVRKWTAVNAEGRRRDQAKDTEMLSPVHTALEVTSWCLAALRDFPSLGWSVLCFINFINVSSEKPVEGLLSLPPAPCSGARGLRSELCCGSPLVTVAQNAFYSRVRYPHRSRAVLE